MKATSIVDHIERLIQSLEETVPLALDQWDKDAIHDARVATRRLKAVLDLLDPVLPDKGARRLKKATRKLRRRLGELRDTDVMLGHLEELSEQKLCDPAVAWVRERLIRERESLRERARQKLSAPRVVADLARGRQLGQGVQALGAAPAVLLGEQLPTQLAEFSEQAEHLAQALGAGEQAGQAKDPHALRIAGKALRYTLELAPAVGFELPASVLKKLKQMQDTLGLWHDYVVLGERILRLALDSGVHYHDPVRYEGLLDLGRLVAGLAQSELHRFVNLWNEQGLPLQQDIRGAFERSRPPGADKDANSLLAEVTHETVPGPACRGDGDERAV